MTGTRWNDVKESLENLRVRLAVGVKWWAEHQAWPATDEIRIERKKSTCR
jgi:hypothetical protein